MNNKLSSLLKWIEEYGIEEEIRNHMISTQLEDSWYELNITFISQWFDGSGEAAAILSHYMG